MKKDNTEENNLLESPFRCWQMGWKLKENNAPRSSSLVDSIQYALTQLDEAPKEKDGSVSIPSVELLLIRHALIMAMGFCRLYELKNNDNDREGNREKE